MTDRTDSLIAALAPVRDAELIGEARSSEGAALLASILESPVSRRPSGRRRALAIAFVALAVAAVASLPALGVGQEIVSLFAGWRDPDAPVPTKSDVLIASGEAGVRWKIVATRSDRGLCLGLFHRVGDDHVGSADCGYSEIRGDLPPDVRGNPASTCIGPPTTAQPGGTLVACGSLAKHWITLGGTGMSPGLLKQFAFGPLAEDVARVNILLSDGHTIHATVVQQPQGLPLNFYWAAWPADDAAPHVEIAIAFDARGRVLERRVPAWNGNPTGDPDGPPPPESVGE